jgi:hypothetical protein
VALEDLMLQASADDGESASGFVRAFGPFGFDSGGGYVPLAAWDHRITVSGNESYSAASLTLTDRLSGRLLDELPFTLSPGVTYRMDATFQAGAQVSPVPEPTGVVLAGVGAVGVWWHRRRSRPAAAGGSALSGVRSS